MAAEDASQRPAVLVVDDEPNNAALLARILHAAYDVDTAGSGEEALQRLATKNFDIIITDQRMPGMTGSEFLIESTKLAPGAIRIVVSAYSDFDATLQAINVAGASAFLSKPVSAGVLEKAIQRAVTRKAEAVKSSASMAELVRRNDELESRVRELEQKLAAK